MPLLASFLIFSQNSFSPWALVELLGCFLPPANAYPSGNVRQVWWFPFRHWKWPVSATCVFQQGICSSTKTRGGDCRLHKARRYFVISTPNPYHSRTGIWPWIIVLDNPLPLTLNVSTHHFAEAPGSLLGIRYNKGDCPANISLAFKSPMLWGIPTPDKWQHEDRRATWWLGTWYGHRKPRHGK